MSLIFLRIPIWSARSTVHKKNFKMSLIFLRISIWSARSTVHGSQKNNTRKFWFQFLIWDFTDATYNSTRSTVHKNIKNVFDFFDNSYISTRATVHKNYKKCPWFFREFLSEVHGLRYTKKKFEKCPWFFWEFLSEVHGPRFTKI